MDRPGKVANPAHVLIIWSRGMGLAVQSRVSLLILHAQHLVITNGIPPDGILSIAAYAAGNVYACAQVWSHKHKNM